MIKGAGTIVFYQFPDKLAALFMKPSDYLYGGDKFQIAKGRIDLNEDSKSASLREAQEELGLILENVIWHKYLCDSGEISFYICEVNDPHQFDEPCFETGETKWLTLEEYLDIGREWQKEIVRDAFGKYSELKVKQCNKISG